MSFALTTEYLITLLAAFLLVIAIYISARFRLENRIVKQVLNHPNTAVFPLEVTAGSASKARSLARLVDAGVFRLTPTGALVALADSGRRRARCQAQLMAAAWTLAFLLILAAALRGVGPFKLG